ELARPHRAGVGEPGDQLGQGVVGNGQQHQLGPLQHLGGRHHRHLGEHLLGPPPGGVGHGRDGHRAVPGELQGRRQGAAHPSGAYDADREPRGAVAGRRLWGCVHARAAVPFQSALGTGRFLVMLTRGVPRAAGCPQAVGLRRPRTAAHGMIAGMSDTARRTEETQETEEPDEERTEGASRRERRARLRERRLAAHRSARRVLSRPVTAASLRERLALLDGAGGLYDLDEPGDLYGDGVVEVLEERTAALLGLEAAAFFPTGTMAQQVALRCWAGRTGSPVVALHALGHPETHERHAFSQVSGLRPVHLTDAPRQPTAEEVRDLDEPFGTLMLELPLREAGFGRPDWEELTETAEAARERDAVVHFDGARLWESTVRLGRPLEEIAGLADSVYVSFYKSLKGYGGAALAGP